MLLALVLLVTFGVAEPGARAAAAPVTYGFASEASMVDARARPDGLQVTLDTMTYQTSAADAPVVILAHGFGGSWEDMTQMAQQLATAGYDVVTWSARGFGRSGGNIGLNDPRYEVDDVRRMVDVAAAMPNHRASADGDPVVAVAGVSYGGAVALMAAAVDPRIDAVVPIATWNDLSTAFFPNAVLAPDRGTSPTGTLATDGGEATAGPFKQLWASRFFGSVQSGVGEEGVCGRMDRTVCRLFLAASDTDEPSEALLEMLRSHSPRPTLDRVTAPTLVIQGVSDSLFGLDQADATVRALTTAGTVVTVRWTTAGHDSGGLNGEAGSEPGSNRDSGNGDSGNGDTGDGPGLTDAVVSWLDHQLRPERGAPATPAFSYPVPPTGRGGRTRELSLPAYPGVGTSAGLALQTVPLPGSRTTWIASPPGGLPASVTAVPGGLDVPDGLDVSSYPLAALPGQSYAVDTEPLTTRLDVVGAPSVRLTVSSLNDAPVLFVSLWQVTGRTAAQLPRPLVAPVKVDNSGAGAVTVEVALPPSTYTMSAGSTWRILVSSTDSAFANPRDTRLYQVAVARAELIVPTASGAVPVSTPGVADRPWQDVESIAVAAAILAVLALIAGWAVWWRRRSRNATWPAAGGPAAGTPAGADVPLVVNGLTKTYADGHRAVDNVSLRAERGQVVGLLGPNGAGKTTTMRMMVGLIRPAAGTIQVLGQQVRPGAPVLGRVGALVEGPGFLPHLTGWQNLQAYWAATGRPAEHAHLHEVLEVAALGDAIDKPVRSYSQGMRQRLGIAQAMLGLPELLILDEPTNGLDPPQIAAMRPILREYAQGGRTVLISSHLLAEVELTCTHVVVMHAGRLITAGAVADLLASDDTTQLDLGPDADVEGVAAALGRVDGVTQVRALDDRTVVVHADLPRSHVVAAAVQAGAPIESVSAHRHLEEVFLGVIADDSAAVPDGGPPAEGSLVDRLRKVRPR